MKEETTKTKFDKEEVILVGTVGKDTTKEAVVVSVEELELLAKTAGYKVHSSAIQTMYRPDSKYYIGSGKAKEIKSIVTGSEVGTIIFDDDLSPAQAKNLENLIDKRILDRTGLILEIFAINARSREAKTQVELARMKYLLPRLAKMWTHLERQTGGIGMRGGMGETQIEIDRRLVGKKIKKLKEDLKLIEKQRDTQKRKRQNMFNVSIVGYTNAGKSTLFNCLSDSGVLVENKLFATLDSRVRKIIVDKNLEVLIADTVGFIKKLPHGLVASFRSTLSIVKDADMLVHVVDLSNPSYEVQIASVNEVLKGLDTLTKSTLIVFNKVDKVKDPTILEAAKINYPDCVFISALNGIGITKLHKAFKEKLHENYLTKTYKIEIKNTKLVSTIYDNSEVIEQIYEEDYTILKVRIVKEAAGRIDQLISPEK